MENFYYILVDLKKVNFTLSYLVWIFTGKLDSFSIDTVLKLQININQLRIVEIFYFIY